MKQGTKTTFGAAAVTGAAAAAAYYLYGSDKAAAHRRHLKSWTRNAEREIMHRAKQLKKAALTDSTIRSVIAEVAQRYEKTKKIDPQDIKEFVGTMQKGIQEARARAAKFVSSRPRRAKWRAKSRRRIKSATQKKI